MAHLRPSYAGLAAAVIAGGMDAVYLAYITSAPADEPKDAGRVALVASTIAGAGCAATAGSLFLTASARLVLLASAATALIVWGILGIFSIGLPLAVAGVLCIYALRDAVLDCGPGSRRAALFAAIAIVTLSAFGLVLTG